MVKGRGETPSPTSEVGMPIGKVVDKATAPLLVAIMMFVGGLFWAEVSSYASEDALASEIEARVDEDKEQKEDLKELTKAVTEHIRTDDARGARVDTMLDVLEKYIEKNGGS